MFDIKWIRANPDAFDSALARRGLPPESANLLALDDERRALVQRMNELQERRNTASKAIGQAKAQKDEARAAGLIAEVGSIKDELPEIERQEREATDRLNDALARMPNMLADDVPDGEDEEDNAPFFLPNETEQTRPQKRTFDFTPKEHYELGEALAQMDFEAAAKLSGSRFVVLQNGIARMERALGQFMLDLHATEHGFTETQVPLLVRDEALFGTGQLPKFEEDLFFAGHDGGRMALIPTAEVPLTNLVRESILSEEELPLRFAALTPCFRSEAGSAGRDTRGMLRQHQFYKVEMVAVTTPAHSEDEQYRMLGCAEAVLKRLDIPYRVMALCAGDMGASMQRTYDIEAWLPGQGTYREISSVSMAGDYQARRMNARYRNPEGELGFVHTLNGSGVATGRALIAVMENYQNADGSITVPEALRGYMGGLEKIG